MRWTRKPFGEGEAAREPRRAATCGFLSPNEAGEIGTPDDPLLGHEAALKRNPEAARAEERSDVEAAIRLYESNVAEDFVGTHPYERLDVLHTRASG